MFSLILISDLSQEKEKNIIKYHNKDKNIKNQTNIFVTFSIFVEKFLNL